MLFLLSALAIATETATAATEAILSAAVIERIAGTTTAESETNVCIGTATTTTLGTIVADNTITALNIGIAERGR